MRTVAKPGRPSLIRNHIVTWARDPVSRFESAFDSFNHVHPYENVNDYAQAFYDGKPPDEAWEIVFRPQVEWVDGPGRVFRTERMDLEWPIIMKQYGLEAVLPPRDSSQANPWQKDLAPVKSVLSDVGANQIREIYAADLELWHSAERLGET
jgi:hypothetical protein